MATKITIFLKNLPKPIVLSDDDNISKEEIDNITNNAFNNSSSIFHLSIKNNTEHIFIDSINIISIIINTDADPSSIKVTELANKVKSLTSNLNNKKNENIKNTSEDKSNINNIPELKVEPLNEIIPEPINNKDEDKDESNKDMDIMIIPKLQNEVPNITIAPEIMSNKPTENKIVDNTVILNNKIEPPKQEVIEPISSIGNGKPKFVRSGNIGGSKYKPFEIVDEDEELFNKPTSSTKKVEKDSRGNTVEVIDFPLGNSSSQPKDVSLGTMVSELQNYKQKKRESLRKKYESQKKLV